LRQRRHGWHRAVGLIVIPSGLIVALSGLWMTLFYRMPAYDGALVYALRLLFGSAMLLALVLGVVALRRSAFVQHGNWMLRGYALGMGAGTQAVTGTVASLLATFAHVNGFARNEYAMMYGCVWLGPCHSSFQVGPQSVGTPPGGQRIEFGTEQQTFLIGTDGAMTFRGRLGNLLIDPGNTIQ
jgi:Predicted membrane protein (DUF2306)